MSRTYRTFETHKIATLLNESELWDFFFRDSGFTSLSCGTSELWLRPEKGFKQWESCIEKRAETERRKKKEKIESRIPRKRAIRFEPDRYHDVPECLKFRVM